MAASLRSREPAHSDGLHSASATAPAARAAQPLHVRSAAAAPPSSARVAAWAAAAAPGRASGLLTGRRSYRQSAGVRRSTSSRAGDTDTVAVASALRVLDADGTNRTPKPLACTAAGTLRAAGAAGVAAGGSSAAALRAMNSEISFLSGESSEVLALDTASMLAGSGPSNFVHGWFDSGAATPLHGGEPGDSGCGGGGLGRAASARVSLDAVSLAGSARPTRTPPGLDQRAAGAGDDSSTHHAGAGVGVAKTPKLLSAAQLDAPARALLQDSGTLTLMQLSGAVVAVDSAEGAAVADANARYAAVLAAREAGGADLYVERGSQTLVPLAKQREAQAGGSSGAEVGCQACVADQATATSGRRSRAAAWSGWCGNGIGAEATRNSSGGMDNVPLAAATALMRTSQQQWGFRASETASFGVSRGNNGANSQRSGGRRTTQQLDSNWSTRPNSSMGVRSPAGRRSRAPSAGGGRTHHVSSTAAELAAAAAAAAAAPLSEPWTLLPGLADALRIAEAAVSQSVHLQQLLLFWDIKLQPPPPLMPHLLAAGGGVPAAATLPALLDDPLCGGMSSASSTASGGRLSSVPHTPSATSLQPRASRCDAWGPAGATALSALGSTAPAGVAPDALSTAGSMRGLGATLAGGRNAVGLLAGSVSGLSRRHSTLLPAGNEALGGSRQSSLMSLTSSRALRQARAPAALQLLWTWSCPMTEGMAATGMAWCRTGTGMLAAGYRRQGGASGEVPTSTWLGNAAQTGLNAEACGQQCLVDGQRAPPVLPPGRVALWSLTNQFHPMWCFDTQSGVTCLDFAQRSPHILAVGLHSGGVALYDIRARGTIPLLAATTATGKHTGPVWQVRWLDRGPERSELLVSVSSDGSIKAWSTDKGLEVTTLMSMKRTPRRAAGTSAICAGGAPGSGARAAVNVGAQRKGGHAVAAAICSNEGSGGGERDPIISRTTGCTSVAFSAADIGIYLAGTEDGAIHRCSTSYCEQALSTHSGHLGPVYAIVHNPFSSALFLSCSGDWTVRLWQEGRPAHLLAFQSGHDEVLDVAWCPSVSTLFAAGTAGGRLDLWDFATSTLRPVATHMMPGRAAVTGVHFARDAPVVVACSEMGGVMVLRLLNVAGERGEPPELQQVRLEEALRANVMKAALG